MIGRRLTSGCATKEGNLMTKMIVVEDRNQDDMSREAGCYLYVDTELWLEDDLVHRMDGPAVTFPDGVEKWYLKGRDVTRDMKTLFIKYKWAPQKGLDTPEKMALFQAHFFEMIVEPLPAPPMWTLMPSTEQQGRTS
jgi:hypothetical protein